jgi:Uncharacterized conserved protein (DUF2190)
MPVAEGGLVEYKFPGFIDTYTAGGTITKGQVVVFTGNRTVQASSGTSRKVAGVALHDAVLNEVLSVAKVGVWGLTAASAIAAGDQLVSAAGGQGCAARRRRRCHRGRHQQCSCGDRAGRGGNCPRCRRAGSVAEAPLMRPGLVRDRTELPRTSAAASCRVRGS